MQQTCSKMFAICCKPLRSLDSPRSQSPKTCNALRTPATRAERSAPPF
jgi:hypothetical protein